MKILKVHINNLNSIRQQVEIDFMQPPLVHAGIFAITGPTGAGKTTLLDAITLALYGQIARSGREVKEVMSYGATECQAAVEFAVGTERYLASWQMHRARNKADGNLVGPKRELAQWKEKANAYVPIAEKIREVEEAVERITKLDYQRFSRSVLLSQGDFAAFLKAGERERSDLLERITGTTIYTELSVAAFERYREEQQQLKQLQEQLAQLGLLAEETIEAEALDKQRKQSADYAAAAEKVQAKVQKLERWLELRQRLEKLAKEKEELQAATLAFEQERSLLQKAVALRPHTSELEQLRFWAQAETEEQSTLAALNAQLETLNEQEEELLPELKKAQIQAQELKATAAAKEETLRAVDRLDQQLDAEKTEQERLNKLLQTQQAALAASTANREALTAQLKEESRELEELTAWLQTHDAQKALPQQLERIEEQRKQLLIIYQQQLEDQKEQEQLRADQERVVKQLADLAQKQATKAQSKAEQLANYQAKLPEDFRDSEDAAASRLSKAIVELQDQQQLMQQLYSLDQEYQQLLVDQQVFESRLADLLSVQQGNNKELLSVVDRQMDFASELQYKRAIYQQQQLIANYEKDRQQLKAGEECPLCLSTEHPFHTHPVKPFVDQAKAELEKAEAYAEKLQLAERQCLQRETELHQEIESLHGNDLQPTSGRLHAQRQKMLAYEERMASLLHGPAETWGNSRGTLLAQRLQILATKLQLWRRAQEELSTLEQQLKQTEAELQQLNIALLQQQGEAKSIAEKLARNQQDVAKQAQHFAQAEAELNMVLAPLGYTFVLAEAKETFAKMRTMSQQFVAKAERKQSLQAQISVGEEKLANSTAQGQQLSKELTDTEATKQAQQERQNKLQKERSELLGDQVVAAVRQAQSEALKAAEERQQQLQTQADSTKEKRLAVVQSVKDKTATQTKRIEAQERLLAKLLPSLKALGYDSVAAARADQLSAEAEETLQARAQSLAQRSGENKRAIQEVNDEEKRYRPADESEEAQQHIRAKALHARQEQEQALLQLGQLEQRYQAQQARAQQHEKLLAEIETQRLAFNRWAQLNEVIGQADGKKFRSFAQGLTLQRLVALANYHLKKLNGRYYIGKTAGQDLALEIVDTFQADNRRSMFTLSGGESFLISLALALGLSDLASRHAQIESLFIDEGFGTLDEHSLDLALDTLENLQSDGKTIGIISHVKALKERISVQIQLRKGSDGFSKVEIVK